MIADQANLIRTLTHELRQPLGTIESIAYYLELAFPAAEPKVKEHLHRLRDLVAQSDSILRDALALTQPTNSRPVTVDLDELIEEFASPHFQLNLGAVPVWIDYQHARKMIETLSQLFRGSVKSPGLVEVTTRVLPSGSVLVKWTGPGLGHDERTLSLHCLDYLASQNQVALFLNLQNPDCLEVAMDVPRAPQFGEVHLEAPSVLAVGAAVGSGAPTAPDIP